MMTTPSAADLPRLGAELGRWQRDDGPAPLHPGDLGWHSSIGAARTAADVRVWTRAGRLAAMGLLDGPVLRMAVDPELGEDEAAAQQILEDLGSPGIRDAGVAVVEARGACALRAALTREGWVADELWTTFRLDLTEPVDVTRIDGAKVRIITATPSMARAWMSVHRSAFTGTVPEEAELRRFADRWRVMAEGPFAHLARHLIALDEDDEPVAVTSVWSGGAGRAGLIEPMGVRRDRTGRGYGLAITLAGLRALREIGASSAVVAAEDSNPGAMATYAAAGLTAGTAVADLKRPA